MPPRWVVIGIVFFWLAATCWQVQRDMWPSWFPPPDEPPNYSVNMTDEFETNYASWQIFINGDDAGGGSSEVKLRDGHLEFKTVLNFQRKQLFDFCTYIASTSRITTKGQLLGMSLKVKIKQADISHIMELDLDARIENGQLLSKVITPWLAMDMPAIQVPENGIVFDPTQLGTRILDIRKGQTWRVPLMDAASLLDLGPASKITEGLVGKELWAAVDEEVIRWGGEDVVCHKIEFTQPGKGVVATTWSRKRDGQVLKQKLNVGLLNVDLLLVRIHTSL